MHPFKKKLWHDQGKWVTCRKFQFQFSYTIFSKLQNASFWCKPHYNWRSGYRVMTDLAMLKTLWCKGIWSLFLPISQKQHPWHPTHSSLSCHICIMSFNRGNNVMKTRNRWINTPLTLGSTRSNHIIFWQFLQFGWDLISSYVSTDNWISFQKSMECWEMCTQSLISCYNNGILKYCEDI